jgi:hypothetical protein
VGVGDGDGDGVGHGEWDVADGMAQCARL